MQNYTVTLSRAHKIAERLGTRIAECKNKAEKASEYVTLHGYTDAQIDRLYEKGREVIEQIELMERLVQAQVHVRTVIGKSNIKHGISDVLTQVEGNKRLLSALTAVVSVQNEGSGENYLKIDEVSKFKPVAQGSESSRGTYVTVTVMSTEQMSHLKSQVEILERKNFELSGNLADLNSEKVVLKLSFEVSDLMGMKAA